jgi:DNA-binding transcriptional MerR regulator
MQIGTLAETAGISAKTIRFYEDRGLLRPPPRTGGGFRDYPADTLQRLAFIRNAQAAGLTLAEIRDILALRDDGQPPCAEVAALIAEHLDQVESRIVELRATRSVLRQLAHRAAELNPDACAEGDICTVFRSQPTTRAAPGISPRTKRPIKAQRPTAAGTSRGR